MQRPAVWAVAGLFAVMGCGEGPESSVTGTVTLDGVELNSGFVTFSSDQGTGAGSASGQIGSGGEYSVQSGRSGGMPAGRYRVTVSSREASKPSASAGPPTPGKLLTPAKYSKAESSGLLFDVKPGHNVIDLRLVSE